MLKLKTYGYKEISPTYISHDPISPEQYDRITIPYHGYQSYTTDTLEGKKWGSGISGYSGIGSNTYHGKRYARDLPVGRTHRHFDSGIFTTDDRYQPQRLTDLHKARCRINDQLLPKPFGVYLDPISTNPELLRTDRDPWSPFKPIHQVFPLDQESRMDHQGRKVLSSTTENTLRNYYHHLHSTPRMQDVYPNHYYRPVYNSWDPSRQAPTTYSEAHPIIPTYCDKAYMLPKRSPSSENTSCHSLENNTNTNIFRSKSDTALHCSLDSATTPKYVHDMNGKHSMPYHKYSAEVQHLIDRLIEIYGWKVVEQLMQNPDFEKIARNLLQCQTHKREQSFNSPQQTVTGEVNQISATSMNPRWPPSMPYTINTKTMQMKERIKILTNLWSDSLTQSNATRENVSSNYVGRPCENTPFNKRAYPFGSHYYAQTEASNLSNTHKFTQPRYEPDSMNTTILPLRNYLYPSGNRTVDTLGISFKSAAQRRYHALHDEAIPDLRENHRTSKRYHFLGLHGASAYRGQCTGIPVDAPPPQTMYSDLSFHGQCSAPLQSFCPKQSNPLPLAYKPPIKNDFRVYRWGECFLQKPI